MSNCMNPSSDAAKSLFVVATPGRSVCDDNARVLHRHGRLRFLALGTRRGTAGVPPEFTRLNPKIGLAAYIAARTLPTFQAEAFRFRLHPWFDRWVNKQLEPGNHIISSYGYVNQCFRRVRRQTCWWTFRWLSATERAAWRRRVCRHHDPIPQAHHTERTEEEDACRFLFATITSTRPLRR